MKTTTRALKVSIALFILGAACLFGPRAQATFIASIEQVGTDVVASGSGSIDLTALTFQATGFGFAANINPGAPTILTGPQGGQSAGIYTGLTGPASFGTGSSTLASSGSGDFVGMQFAPIGLELLVPPGFVSGNPLSSTSTYNNATVASLGVTPGIYTWTWGTGVHADSFILYAGVPVPGGSVPETGSTLMLSLLGLTAICGIRFSQRRPA